MPCHVLAANGVANVRRDHQFFIYLGNFTSTDITLSKHFWVAFARPPPTFTFDAINAGGPTLDKQEGVRLVKIVKMQVVMKTKRTTPTTNYQPVSYTHLTLPTTRRV